MSTSFGKEIGLIHEVIIRSRKYGADETLWKALLDDRQFLVHMIDYASFYHGTRVHIIDGDASREIVFACFAQQTDWVGHEEIISRVERFGRFATDEELKISCAKLQEAWAMADCPELQFPIVAFSPENIRSHESYFWAITYGAQGGRPTLSKLVTEKQKRAEDQTFHWAPGTTFAVVCKKLRSIVSFDRAVCKSS